MILDLPKEFPLSHLSQMDLGVAEARDDELLLKCATPLPMFQEIISGRKDIIHGYRGTGKSSIVRLFSEGVLKFDEEAGFTSHVLVIDEELEYRTIHDYIQRQSEKGTSTDLLLRVVWDLLICYRSMKFTQELIGDSDPTLRENILDVEILFGTSKRKVGLIELMLTQKKKIGVKLDSNLPSIVDIYAGLEPSTPPATEEEVSILKIVDHIKYLSKLLQEKKLTIHVLLDRLDDFVVQENYETQRALLQQLLACQAEYRSKYGKGRLKVVTFLRTDLFSRIDQQPLGPDKVAQRSLEIRWTSSDIRRFLSKRLALNLLKIMKKDSFQIQFDETRCWITRDEISKLEETKTTIANFNILNKAHWEKIFWLFKVFKRRQKNDSRISSFDDAQNEAIINVLMPKIIHHRNIKGDIKDIGVFEFLDTHFQLGFGHSTPRVILLYLSEVLQAASDYYNSNSDIKLFEKADGGYDLFNKNLLLIGYKNFQDAMWDIQIHISGSMRPLMTRLSHLRDKERFSFRAFITMAGTTEEETKQFLSFCTHTGLLHCISPNAKPTDREYKIPIIFQNPTEKSFIDTIL